jgi:hypothetical protein
MNISLKCQCGSVTGTASNLSPAAGMRIVCMCADCQAFAHFLGKANTVLDKSGGTEIFQMSPCDLKITHGIEHLKCMRLTDKGLCRWYAGCCNTAIANTMSSHKVPFSGVIHVFMDCESETIRQQALGRVLVRIHAKSGVAPLPPDTHPSVPLGFMLRVIRFLFSGLLKGRNTPSPFFDPNTGKLIIEPYVLTSVVRENLRKLCGP